MNRVEQIRSHLVAQQFEMTSLLHEFVELETPSNEKAAVDRFGRFLAEKLAKTGFEVEVLGQSRYGDNLRATWGEGRPRILTLCHMDTVWPLGEVAKRPFTLEGNVAKGPGANDMKSGIVSLLFAIQALNELGIEPGVQIISLFTSDEEDGSPQSRTLIEQEARHCDMALIFEPGTAETGGIKTWRKGVGIFTIEITGRASHAGANPEGGVSAITELAHQILHVQGLAVLEKGTTVSVGVVQGGAKSNIIPALATAIVDVRVKDMDEAERITQQMQALKPVLPDARITVSGGINRWPMQKTKNTGALYNMAAEISHQVGVPVAEEGSGGATDGNLVAVHGVPVLDGVGPLGGGSHSVDEFCQVDTIPLRAAMVALLLIRLGQQSN